MRRVEHPFRQATGQAFADHDRKPRSLDARSGVESVGDAPRRADSDRFGNACGPIWLRQFLKAEHRSPSRNGVTRA